MNTNYIGTIRSNHIGKSRLVFPDKRPISVSSVMGRVQEGDVGKRLYLVDGVVQVENNEQRDRRILGEELVRQNEKEVKGYSIAVGGPTEGFEFYGFFETELDAATWANEDPHLPSEWTVIEILAV